MVDPQPPDVVPLGLWDQAARRAVRRTDPGALLAEPRAVANLSDLEAAWAVKQLGVEDAVPLLAHLNPEQTQTLLDLEVWSSGSIAPADVLSWLAGFREAGLEALANAVRAWDPEAAAAFLARRLHIAFKPTDDTPPDEIPDWLRRDDEESPLFTTPDDRFLVAPRASDPADDEPVDEDERDNVLRLVADLYRDDDWEHAAGLLRMAMSDDRWDLEETALRFRTGRLEDLGFPPAERAGEVYAWLDRLPPPSPRPLVPSAVALVSAYVPPADAGLFFQALRRIQDPQVVARIESEVVPLANAVLVADGAPWSSPEAVAAAVTKVIGHVQVALDFEDETEATADVSAPTLDRAAERLVRYPLRTLFRWGTTQIAKVATRVRRLECEGAFRVGEDPWALLEPSDRDAAAALAAATPRFPKVLAIWRSPERRGRPLELEGIGEREPFTERAQLDAALGFVDHIEGWATADGALGLSTALQALEADVWPPDPSERTLRAALVTALAQAWLGKPFELRPLRSSDVAALADQLGDGGELGGREALLSALSARLPPDAADAARREAEWGLARLAESLAPFKGVGQPDLRFIEGIFVRKEGS